MSPARASLCAEGRLREKDVEHLAIARTLHVSWRVTTLAISGSPSHDRRVAAIVSFVGGLVLVGPSVAMQTRVEAELADGDGVPNDDLRRRLAQADRVVQVANRFDLPLTLLAGLTIAVGRYL